MLGGVKIAHDAGVVAHSDGDVALHALVDALLGAVGRGDIGRHFPADDPRWEGADSMELLQTVMGMMVREGWAVVNADLTIVCQRPRVAPHADGMRSKVADALGVSVGAVSIKATTTDGLGFCGRGEGLAAMASVLVRSE